MAKTSASANIANALGDSKCCLMTARMVSVVHRFGVVERCLDREFASSTFCVDSRLLRTRHEKLSCRDRKESTRYRTGICSEYRIRCCCSRLAQAPASVECANPKCLNFASLREQNREPIPSLRHIRACLSSL